MVEDQMSPFFFWVAQEQGSHQLWLRQWTIQSLLLLIGQYQGEYWEGRRVAC